MAESSCVAERARGTPKVSGQAEALRRLGADVAVQDLGELLERR
jgi:hypothetical protein